MSTGHPLLQYALSSALSLGCLLCGDGLVGGHELLKEAAAVVVVVCKAQHFSSTALSCIQDCMVKEAVCCIYHTELCQSPDPGQQDLLSSAECLQTSSNILR